MTHCNGCGCNDGEEHKQQVRASPRAHRIYGRGLFDGLRMAGVTDVEAFMNQAKLERASDGLNGMARKVLDAVPIAERWTRHAIVSEMHRATGCSPDLRVVEGCLAQLQDKGLITQTPQGFARVAARATRATLAMVASVDTGVGTRERTMLHERQEAQEAAQERAQDVDQGGGGDEPPSAPLDPLTRLATVAQQLRILASAIESIALDSAVQNQERDKRFAKLDQLQEILKSLGGGA